MSLMITERIFINATKKLARRYAHHHIAGRMQKNRPIGNNGNKLRKRATMSNTTDELIEILVELLGVPLVKDMTYKVLPEDPYGRNQLADTSRSTVERTEPIPESYITIARQYRRLPQAKQAIKQLINQARIKEVEYSVTQFEASEEYAIRRIKELKRGINE